MHTETCPFCRNSLPYGATACGYCGAFKSSPLAQAPAITQLLIYGTWLMYGPGPLALWMFTDVTYKSKDIWIAIAATIFGFYILGKLGSIIRWYRYN
jgi:hypothetical protein